ncbi:MAG TPA: hypothetical protein VN861_03515 [Candidatus Acidoferrales bacterium]|nr:hypothetical protein [Candidatus Acidoferrales bacterium]
MPKVRIIRVLEYIGDEDWLRRTLERSAVKESIRLVIPNGEIAEVSRTVEEVVGE